MLQKTCGVLINTSMRRSFRNLVQLSEQPRRVFHGTDLPGAHYLLDCYVYKQRSPGRYSTGALNRAAKLGYANRMASIG